MSDTSIRVIYHAMSFDCTVAEKLLIWHQAIITGLMYVMISFKLN